MELQKVILHQNKTFSIKRQHPWIFSGAILKKDHKISDGDMVDVYDEQGQFLGFGHFHLGSIAVKMLSFGSKHFTDKFWKVRFPNLIRLCMNKKPLMVNKKINYFFKLKN